MYLKRLEIQGFKSFADKVEFEFPSGITAIVGPNGSGKSNVVDSIRWVLGEQSVKNLRGSKMEDVIFAGSAERRPLGMAQVSLTLDNSARIFDLDYEEVTVSRRLYRSGESEYLINKSPSRLKDIQELFMDTGLGREGLSIISQGKVDEILSLKPEDRRGLIEEAAGIIKYKYRKREAERKLKDTEDNLLRVEDIINELAERVGPLGEQAEKAKDYKEKKAMLDGLELSMEVHDMVKNQAQEKELLTQHGQMEDAMAEQSAKLSAQDAELSQMRLDAQQEETAFQEQQQSYYDLQN
ncbi:MAG: AAA family ATPase, partial [Peptococcaceae bacterium]|nr:AAA family ATPase [Peptococcaceae bacterium]